MTEAPRTYKRPVEEVAQAIYESRNGAGCLPWARREAAHKQPYRGDATAALTRLRELGFIDGIGLAAIRAEEASNGLPRSVIGRSELEKLGVTVKENGK